MCIQMVMVVHKLHHMMENEDNAEKKNALKLAIMNLEQH